MDIGNPAAMRENDNHRPNKRGQNEQNIKGGQIIVFEAKLERSKGEIKNEIQNKRQSNDKRNSFLKKHQKHFAERNSD